MIQLIHGPDIVSSRLFLLKLKNTLSEIAVLDAKTLAKNKLAESLNQINLFGKVLIVDWFEEKNFSAEIKEIKAEVIFWSPQQFKDTTWAQKVNFFPIKSVGIFKLTDAFGLRQEKLAQEYLDVALKEKNPPEVVLSLLSRQLRLIGLALGGQLSSVSNSSFVQQKISDQSKLWSEKAIKRSYRALLEADLGIKTGLDAKFSLSMALAKSHV